MPDVQGRCPACGDVSLFLGEGGHVTCSRIDCPDPTTADDLLQSGEAALARLLGGALIVHLFGKSYWWDRDEDRRLTLRPATWL